MPSYYANISNPILSGFYVTLYPLKLNFML